MATFSEMIRRGYTESQMQRALAEEAISGGLCDPCDCPEEEACNSRERVKRERNGHQE